MSRPVGVTASAIVAILGSVLTLVLAVFVALAPFILPPGPPQPPYARQAAMVGAAMFAALAIIGMWTSVGLFRMRSWARTSILVFAGFLAAGCVFSLLMVMAVPTPPGFGSGTEQTFRGITVVMFGLPFAIGVWWLLQFNTRSTKAAFLSTAPADTNSPRPLSISVIAWVMIVGAVSLLYPILTHSPGFLFGVTMNGWAAVAMYIFFGVVSLYIGKGLLDLKERARIVAIGWFGFWFLHLCLITYVPPLRQRMLELQRELVQKQQGSVPFDPARMTSVMLIVFAITTAAAIGFLIRDRDAFARKENS